MRPFGENRRPGLFLQRFCQWRVIHVRVRHQNVRDPSPTNGFQQCLKVIVICRAGINDRNGFLAEQIGIGPVKCEWPAIVTNDARQSRNKLNAFTMAWVEICSEFGARHSFNFTFESGENRAQGWQQSCDDVDKSIYAEQKFPVTATPLELQMSTSTLSHANINILPQFASRSVGFVVLAVLGSAIMAISAKISVPFFPVPMTLQTLAIFAIAAAYGRNLAVATMVLYLAEGLVGIPVFAGAVAGPAYMMGSTGGYLAGFVVAAAIIGWAADKGWSTNAIKMAGAMIVADIVIFGLGFAWLSQLIGAEKAFTFGVVPFVLGDLVKIALASSVIAALWKVTRKA